MAEERRTLRKRYIAISDLFEARKDLFLTSLLSALMLLCIAPLQPADNNIISQLETSETSGRDSVYEGDWAAYKQLPFNDGSCDKMSYDNKNDYLAMTYCPDYYSLEILIYHNSDWNTLVSTIESDLYPLDFMEFSPNGGYLILIRNQYFEVYQTSDWQHVFSGDVTSDDGTYYGTYDITWSGDEQRLVISGGSNGGKMYEGPDWDEVDGTNSNGQFVAHHPSEDILWYLNYDGSGSEYEYENIPFVGYQWVLKQNFNIDSELTGQMTASPSGDFLLLDSYEYVSAFSSSGYSQLFSSEGENPAFSSDGNHVIFNTVYYGGDGYKIYSTESWLMTSENDDSDVYQSAFSSDDSEIITSGYESGLGYVLTGWMPDEDSDGIVNVQDLCSDTPEDEEADIKGCAPSQKDTDLDGVNDRDDTCPRTSTSDSVNYLGCSESQLIDTDDDGVSDSDDICPGTPSSEFSNIYGCSKSQRDVDGDGVPDSLDNCPLHDIESCPNVLSWTASIESIDGTEDLYNPKWSPEGDLIATYDTNSDNILILDDTFLIAHEISIQNESQSLRSSYSWSPTGEWLLIFWGSSNYQDSSCGYYIWDVENQSLSPSYEISNECNYIRSYAISPDGALLATSFGSYYSYGKTLMIDLVNDITIFEDDDHYPRKLIFSHDGTTLIGSSNSQILLWDTNDGYLLQARSVGSFDSMLLSPDGDSIYTAKDENIRIYSLNTLALISSTSIEGDISNLAFSRSNELLYVSLTERTYDENWNRFDNFSIDTYQINSNQSLQLIIKSDVINETSTGYPNFSPDEKSVLIQFNTNSGLYLWESDSDGDKITDASDLCEDTNLSESSDETGCSWEQKDDDEDDVINKQDLCLNTPIGIGMLVDESGCSDQQVDEDFDGVCNEDAQSAGPSGCVGEDSCPSTPSGKVVDSTGCSWEQQDDDLDSVQNSIDICPDTSLGEVADSVGCGETQRDSDGDFVNDYWDVCSSTEINSTVDNFGCSDLQVDSDSDTVCNTNAPSPGPSNCTQIDICPNTESNTTVDTYGCSWNQRDDDGDGVFNPYDSCPDTSNPEVSPDGCSSWQRDSDNDGIVDILDECAKTPEDEFSNQVGCSEGQRQSSLGFEEGGGSSIIKWATIGGVLLVILLLGGFLLNRKKSSEDLTQPKTEAPQYATRGVMEEDGKEWIEFPAGSSNRFYRDQSSGQWVKNK